MQKPPYDPRFAHTPDQPTWTGLAASLAMVPAVVLALWVLASPLVRTGLLVAVAVLVVATGRAARLAWCVQTCRELTLDLAGGIEVTVTRAGTTAPN